ncbi:hypothetical protein S7711_10767 [Stachybotrys chartarum IBT 7711]|uniref:Zn(2)-C6 fungal-type domain-containing protein n=1 Tax=Stachybotrys chartarum (strain CBS 109288 / IBT 7711) TaxID=1280523 RepID=A0A084AU85_STACB|nr:hypothetical protein S7711_10767 [Stachybotrys chartarum IBT 7711]KFA74028.1 hypothetical protein S40288_11003 [Stachybotrys chartarum IBT 40288]
MDFDQRARILLPHHFNASTPNGVKRPFRQKTRAGCVGCKSRKVKCDEAKPACQRCCRNSRPCVYEALPPKWRSEGHAAATPTVHLRGSSEAAATRRAHRSVNIDPLSATTALPFELSDAKNGTPSSVLIRHTHAHWDAIFPMPHGVAICELLKSDYVIRNAILALAACHLGYSSANPVQHRIAEYYLGGLAITGCRELVSKSPRELGEKGVRSLLAATIFISLLGYHSPKPEVEPRHTKAAATDHDIDASCGAASQNSFDTASYSWAFSPQGDRPDWITLQSANRFSVYKVSLVNSRVDVHSSMGFLAGILLGDETKPWAETALTRDFFDAPAHWLRLYELSEIQPPFRPEAVLTAGPREAYGVCVSILLFLRRVEPVRRNVSQVLQFIIKMPPAMRQRMKDGDVRAFALFGVWLGLMCRFKGLWWCEGKVQRNYQTVLAWLVSLKLTELPGQEGLDWAAMLDDIQNAPNQDTWRTSIVKEQSEEVG